MRVLETSTSLNESKVLDGGVNNVNGIVSKENERREASFKGTT